MSTKKTIFSQIMSLVSRYEFQKCVDRYKGDWHAKTFTCFDQFKVMSFAQFTDRSGLRDIEMTLEFCGKGLYHAGLSSVHKSTLAEANERRNWMIYRDFSQVLIKEAKELYRNDYFRLGLKEMVYALDSTTIRLCLELSPWAEFHHGEGAVKMHTLIDLRGNIPSYIIMTNGLVHDSKVMPMIPVEAYAFYLMDKGYVFFKQLYECFHLRHAYFVTRAKENMVYDIVEEYEVDKAAGLISDQLIRLTGKNPSVEYPEPLRMVVYEDYATGNVYRFLTNNLYVDTLTVAELYRERWMVELFFKWVKQHLHIKKFYGTSENAVYLQLWIAVCDYLLLIIAKKKFCLPQTLHTISNSIGPLLFKQDDIHFIFNNVKEINNECPKPQYVEGNLF